MKRNTKRTTIEQIKAELADGHEYVSQRRDYQTRKDGKQQVRHYVTIRCENGHEYESLFCNYKRKQACGKCAGKQLTDEDIRAMIRPGFTLKKIIRGKPNKVRLECENGHEYEQILYGHANGTGCRFCSGHYTKTDEEIRAALRPGYTFTGRRRRCNSNTQEIEIICAEGHKRWQKWTAVANGRGCYKCGGTAPLTEDEVKERIRDGYTYMAMKRTGQRYTDTGKRNGKSILKVKLCCEYGHVYWQPLRKHSNGAGCRECKYTGGYRTDRPGAYYYIRIDTPDGEVIYKHGITNREYLFTGNNIKSRYQLRDGKFCTVLLYDRNIDGRIPIKTEKRVQARTKKSMRYKGDWKFSCNTKHTEIYTYDFLGLDPNAEPHDLPVINYEKTKLRVMRDIGKPAEGEKFGKRPEELLEEALEILKKNGLKESDL
jgi:hypothetical protein